MCSHPLSFWHASNITLLTVIKYVTLFMLSSKCRSVYKNKLVWGRGRWRGCFSLDYGFVHIHTKWCFSFFFLAKA